jgi:hypothetical protein
MAALEDHGLQRRWAEDPSAPDHKYRYLARVAIVVGDVSYEGKIRLRRSRHRYGYVRDVAHGKQDRPHDWYQDRVSRVYRF